MVLNTPFCCQNGHDLFWSRHFPQPIVKCLFAAQYIPVVPGFDCRANLVRVFRCGKAKVWWRLAGLCWVKPTLQIPNLEPSEETSALMSASEFADACFYAPMLYFSTLKTAFWHSFQQEHHPWQWLCGKCRKGDLPVVSGRRAGQLHKLCLWLALLNHTGCSAPTVCKPMTPLHHFLSCLSVGYLPFCSDMAFPPVIAKLNLDWINSISNIPF